jgi:TPR repeat protein
MIGQTYLLGTQSVPKDIVLAEYWFTQSARQGYLRAVKELGKIMIERADSLKSKLKLE